MSFLVTIAHIHDKAHGMHIKFVDLGWQERKFCCIGVCQWLCNSGNVRVVVFGFCTIVRPKMVTLCRRFHNDSELYFGVQTV
jgi:hypothetical protein